MLLRSRAHRARLPLVLVPVVVALVLAAAAPAIAQEATTATAPPTSVPPTSAPPSTTPTAGTAPGSDTTPGSSTPAANTTPHPDPDAFAALANQVTQNQSLLTELSTEVTQTTQRLAVLASEIADTQQKLAATRAQMDQLRQIVRARAAYIYAHADAPQVAVADIQHVEDLTVGKKYADSATQADASHIHDLGRVANQLDQHEQDLETQQTQQQQQKDRLVAAQAALASVTARQKKLLDEAGAVPVMGDAELTPADVADWFTSRGVHYQLAGGMDIKDLVQLYFDEGRAEHVRPELAFAQAIIETGSFGTALDSNYAGIGACDSCVGEPAFPTPRDGVRGQIQLLRNYADPTSRAANLANPPSPTIYGSDPVAAAHAYDTFFAKGTVPTWNAMGNGNWATDPGYAPKVLTVPYQMVSFAAKRNG